MTQRYDPRPLQLETMRTYGNADRCFDPLISKQTDAFVPHFLLFRLPPLRSRKIVAEAHGSSGVAWGARGRSPGRKILGGSAKFQVKTIKNQEILNNRTEGIHKNEL